MKRIFLGIALLSSFFVACPQHFLSATDSTKTVTITNKGKTPRLFGPPPYRPAGCSTTALKSTITKGLTDDYILPIDPTSPTPNLAASIAAIPSTSAQLRSYDQVATDKYFGDSFFLKPLLTKQICYAALEIRVKGGQPIWYNDSITIGKATGTFPIFGTSNVNAIFGDYIWGSNSWVPFPGFTTSNYIQDSFNSGSFVHVLTPSEISQANLLIPSNNGYLDVYSQDDSTIDFIRFTYWYQ